MADKWPLANGNWSNAANWNGGTKPVAGDDVYADGKAVTIDENVTVLSIQTTQRAGGTLGGVFYVGTTININANIINAQYGITFSGTFGTVLTINGNVTAANSLNQYAVTNSSSGTINIIGNVTGGTQNSAVGVLNSSSGIINITGTVSGGTAGIASRGVINSGTGSINITGNCFGGGGSWDTEGVRNASAGTITIIGNVTGGSVSNSYGVANGSTGTVIITGNATGGTGSVSAGVANLSTGSVTINGNAIGGIGSGATGAINASTGLLRVFGIAIGNDYGLGYSSNNGNVGVSGFGINSGVVQATTTVRGIRYGAKGQSPTSGLVQLDISNLASSSARFRTEPNSFTEYTFGPPENIGGQPAASNVRLGTVYNFGNTIGTLAVPPPSSVAYGVAVDNTSGIAIITESALRSLLESSLAPNAQTIAERSDDDTKALTFSWPVSGVTITGQKSVDNGAYTNVVGAIGFLRTESNRHYYTLAYNAADRASSESTIRYKMTDGTFTKYFNVRIMPSTNSEVVAIKAKTDNLPADPASSTQITSLLNNAPTEAF